MTPQNAFRIGQMTAAFSAIVSHSLCLGLGVLIGQGSQVEPTPTVEGEDAVQARVIEQALVELQLDRWRSQVREANQEPVDPRDYPEPALVPLHEMPDTITSTVD